MATRRIPRIRTRLIHEADSDLGYLGCLLVDDNRVYACGGTYNHSTLLVSDDGARSWRRLTPPPRPGLRSLAREDDALYLVGEYGLLAASLDGGLTWTELPVDTETCLFHLHRGPDRSWWVIGDGGVILRSTDGVAYTQLANDDWDTRLLYITTIGGAVHILGYDGAIKRWTGTAFEQLPLEHDSALTQLIETKTGAWIVTGDGGAMFRSDDKGKTFTRVTVPTDSDLEAILELPQGILVAGNEVLLFSDDDGRTWWRVDNELEGHLWSLALVPNGAILVGGDEGAIWVLDVSATETMDASDEAPDDGDDDDDDDDDDNDDDDNDDDDDDDDDDEAAEPATFASIDEASARWIREGTEFAGGLNAYVRRVYEVGPNKAGHEPSETRQDMADYVRARLVELNEAGQHRRARELFPPAYEPFDYDGLGQEIQQLAFLADGRIVARVGFEVFELQRDRVVPIADVQAFAQSPDRRYVAKLYDDRIAVHDGWDGPCVRTFAGTLPSLRSATLTPEGDALLVASETGMFWITERGRKLLMPDEEGDLSYAHAALSPNGRFVALGCQDSAHVLIDRKTGRRYTFDPASSYPHYAAFHRDRPHLIFSSCHGLYGSATIGVDLEGLVAGRKETSGTIDQRAWVYAVASAPFGYILGDRGGYLWALDFAGDQQWYCFLGSTMTAIDITPDGKRLVAGSYAGIVVELDLTAGTPDPRLLTDGPVRDVQRWLFWQGHAPMLW